MEMSIYAYTILGTLWIITLIFFMNLPLYILKTVQNSFVTPLKWKKF